MRLQVFLSHSGVASRRSSAEIILAGRVKVNERLITKPGHHVTTADSISVDNLIISPEVEKLYIMLHKPAKVISSAHDPEGRETVIDIVSPSFAKYMFPVGRLDYMSTGLMLLTNDGYFAQHLGHPRSGYTRKYEVQSATKIPRELLMKWQRGINIEGIQYKLTKFQYLNPRKVIVILNEGKNREIRRVFETEHIAITSLHRIQFGSLSLGNLKAGKFREISAGEVKKLLDKRIPNKYNKKQGDS